MGLEGLRFFKIHHGIGDDDAHITHDDAHITHLYLTGSSTVQTDTARATLTFYYIGLETFTIVIVNNLHLLAGNEVSCIHEIFIDGDATHVVEISSINRIGVLPQ